MHFSLLTMAAAIAIVSAAPLEPTPQTAVVTMRHSRNVTSMHNVVARGRARIDRMNGLGTTSLVSRSSSGYAVNDNIMYDVPVKIGGKIYTLLVDTGSSITWCGARAPCEKSATGQASGGKVSVSYGSGAFDGIEYTDQVSFAGLTVLAQSIGAASDSFGFSDCDGIIGFGPVGLTKGEVSSMDTVPTFLDNLYKQGSISTEVLGVYFQPECCGDSNDANGELTLGGTDSSKYSGSITYFPTLTSGVASSYWGIAVASFTYGSTTLASSAQAIVDTGTTMIYIPDTAYNKFLSMHLGQTDGATGLARFMSKPTSNFAIKFGSTTYTLTPAQYLIPADQYSYFRLDSRYYYAWISNGGIAGVNTIIGQKFLENYYSVFDTTNSRIGFATRT